MATDFMWKSLEPYFFLSMSSLPFYADCKKKHIRLVRSKVIPWLCFVSSIFVQFLSESYFLFKLLQDKKFYDSVTSVEILLFCLYMTILIFYLITFYTFVNYHYGIIQLLNGVVFLQKRFTRGCL